MILNFRDRTSSDIFHGEDSKAARKISKSVWSTACRKLDMINAAHELRDLQLPPGNRLERLKGNLAGFHSIRVNDQYRVIFRWSDGNARDVQITDYHS
jgi:proteic killer suppression protein